MKYSNETYEARKAKGVCVRCGWAEPRPGRLTCQRCADRAKTRHIKSGGAERQHARYIQRKEAGICTWCGTRPAVPGVILCAACREKSCESCRQWYYKKRRKQSDEG